MKVKSSTCPGEPQSRQAPEEHHITWGSGREPQPLLQDSPELYVGNGANETRANEQVFQKLDTVRLEVAGSILSQPIKTKKVEILHDLPSLR